MAARVSRSTADVVSMTEFTKVREELSQARRRIRDLEYERTRVRKKPVPDAAVEAIAFAPTWLADALEEVVTDKTMREHVTDALVRRKDYRNVVVAILSGVGMNRKARDHIDKAMDAHWSDPERRSRLRRGEIRGDTVIIGGGLHASIYSGVLASVGQPKPIVIERGRPGGVFGCSRGPSFYLNSPNRAGFGSSIPRRGGALNFLPGCDLQPSDLDGAEYQTNDMMAWAIRCNLAMTAEVFSELEVGQVQSRTLYDNNRTRSVIAQSYSRVIYAGGFPKQKRAFNLDSPMYISFEQFMAMMDRPFPLQGIKKICVLGAGDSGKCVIEALCGQGPRMLTNMNIDRPDIDWFGVPVGCRGKDEWMNRARPRYKGIARLLASPTIRNTASRLCLRGNDDTSFKAQRAWVGVNCIYVDGEPYDLVIDCSGYDFDPGKKQPVPGITPSSSLLDPNGSQWGATFSYGFVIGVAATPYINPSTTDTRQFRQIGENKTSIFYLAKKTEGVALRFSGVGTFES